MKEPIYIRDYIGNSDSLNPQESKVVPDGEYWLPYNAPFLWIDEGRESDDLTDDIKQQIDQFRADYGDVWLAAAYEVYGFYLLASMPEKLEFREECGGSGFNYGSCNLLPVNEPGYVLIIAQND